MAKFIEFSFQMEINSGHNVYSHVRQELRSQIHGRMLDPSFSNISNLSSCSSSHAALGNSFLALLSGPASLLQFDIQEPLNSSSKLPIEFGSVIISPSGSKAPQASSALLSENGSYQNMPSGADLYSIVSSRAVANSICGSNFVFQNGLPAPAEKIRSQGSDLPKPVVHHIGLGNEQVKDFSSLRGEWGSMPVANALKLPTANNQIPQKVPVEAESSSYQKSSTSAKGCPHVFCLDRSGDLLLSNTGLLGILCSCHCFHMSVSKFCEHSGLWNVNPGDAVRMDSGETIAQWRRIYFQKFGIRVPEDESGWDWPEGLSLTASLVKSGVSKTNMLKNSASNNLWSGQPLGDVFPKNFLAGQNLVIDSLCDKQQRNSQDGNKFYLRGLVANLQNSTCGVGDNHVNDYSISRCSTAPKFAGGEPENMCQSMYIDSIVKTGSLATTHPSLQNCRNLVKDSDVSCSKDARVGAITEKDASSSVELKLGQPYQQNQSPGNSVLPVIGQSFYNALVNSQKPFPQEQMSHNVTSFRGEKESRIFLNRSAGLSNSTTREQDHLNYGNCAINNAMDGAKLETLKATMAKTSVVSLFKNYTMPEGSSNPNATNNLFNMSEHVIPEKQHCETRTFKSDPVNVTWKSDNGLDKQCMLPDLGFLKPEDKGKGVGCLAGNSYIETAPGSKMHKWMAYPSSFTGAVSGNGFSTVMHDKNRYSHHLSNVPTDVSAGKFSNCLEKVPCFGSSHIDQLFHKSRRLSTGSGQILSSQAVPVGSHSSLPTSIPGLTPATFNQQSIGVSPHLLDDNLRLLAVGQILELSKQQLALSSLGKNLEQGKCNNSSINSFVKPSTSEEQRLVPKLNGKQDVSKVAMKLDQPGPTTTMTNEVDKFASVTGWNRWGNFSMLTQGMPLQCKEIGMQCQLSCSPLQNEHPSLRGNRNQNDITLSNEHDNCCQRTHHFHYNCSCAAHTCPGGKCNFSGNPSNSLGGQTGSFSGKTPILIASQFAKDHIIPKENSISIGQCGTLKGQLSKNISYNASQWKDVPSKVRVCEVASIKGPADALDRRGLEDSAAKFSNEAINRAECFNDRDMSNISSGCSTPAVTQASVGVTNVDSSTVVGNTGYVDNLVVDEGSGIDKCGSSDDAFESERSAYYGYTCKSTMKKKESCKVSGNKSSRTLLDEVKLMDSLTWRRSRNKKHSCFTVCGKTDQSQESERGLKTGKRKREMKLKMLDVSLRTSPPVVHDNYPECDADWPCSSNNVLMVSSGPESSQTSGAHYGKINAKHGNSALSITKSLSHKRNLQEIYNSRDGENNHDREMNRSDNSCKIPEISDRKKLRSTQTADICMELKMQELTPAVGEKILMYDSVNYLKASSSRQVKSCYRKAKPVVCGNYGEITNCNMSGDVTRSFKIVSLDRILKTARRCSLKDSKPGLTSSREWKREDVSWGNAGFDRCSYLKEGKENGSNVNLESQDMNTNTSLEERDVAFSSEDEQSADEFSVLEKREETSGKVQIMLGTNAYCQSKTKYKETRKRSIYELTLKGKNPSPKMVSQRQVFKCKPNPKIKLQQTGKDTSKNHIGRSRKVAAKRYVREQKHLSITDVDSFCCVCGSSKIDDVNCLLECGRCYIRVHQACYGVSRVPKGHWYCRPCRTSSENIVCVLCGYGGGAMTRALRSCTIVKSLLKIWNLDTGCRHKNAISSAETMQDKSNLFYSSEYATENSSYPVLRPLKIEPSTSTICNMDVHKQLDILQNSLCCISHLKVHNSITAGVLNSTVKQWVHVVCGLWTPGTRCPNVDTMSAFDVSGASCPRANVACSMCNRPGGSCIQCRDMNCSVQFHPWCAHQKGLLQSEAEGIDNENVGFYGTCVLHATGPANDDAANIEAGYTGEKEGSCARTEGYMGRKRDGFWHSVNNQSNRRGGCLVPQEQLNAWVYINGQKSCAQGLLKLPISEKEYDCRKEYARYKQAKGWKHLVVYKSGIHALGLYTSRFISRGG
ncbi:hypothetical protein MANES_03G012400v8 [Manihot esculenta]|uniref:Uncharacterized protein n=1 Tax=Manihot esculenta TaxID=3983 RepID=A0ACB7I191_MANES|nr:hypothetical protein MANES_03G012400v8 [Manihot esculenta]